MDSELIDLIYQNKEVEGLAIFDANNQLIENQLSLNVSKVMIVAKTLHDLKLGLNKAGREMRGFLIKSESISLLTCMFPDYLILLEVSEGSSLNDVDSSLRSIFRSNVVPPDPPVSSISPSQAELPVLPTQPVQSVYPAQPNQPTQPAQVVQPDQIEPATTPQPILPPQSIQPLHYTQVYPAAGGAAGVDFVDFENKLSKLLKTVAPLKVITGMIHSAMADMGLDVNAVQLPQDVANELGYKVIAKIPNKARRQIIEKEYAALVQSGQ